MDIICYVEFASSGLFFCRLSLLVLRYILAAVVLVGASITEFCLYSDGTV